MQVDVVNTLSPGTEELPRLQFELSRLQDMRERTARFFPDVSLAHLEACIDTVTKRIAALKNQVEIDIGEHYERQIP